VICLFLPPPKLTWTCPSLGKRGHFIVEIVGTPSIHRPFTRAMDNARNFHRLAFCLVGKKKGDVPFVCGEVYKPAATFAVSSMPSAFMTASVVFNVGLPFALNER